MLALSLFGQFAFLAGAVFLSARRTIRAKGFLDGIIGGALWLYSLVIGGAFLFAVVIPSLLLLLGVDRQIVLKSFPEAIGVPPAVLLGWFPSFVFSIVIRYANDVMKMAQGKKPLRRPGFGERKHPVFSKTRRMKGTAHYDLAVVGGGIAGLYCCLRAPAGMSVALFEATDRVGGKIETVVMEGFQAEYGAMRFDPVRQPAVGMLLNELHLETEPFPEYNSPPVEERRTQYDLAAGEKDLNALELFTEAIGRVLGKSGPDLMGLTAQEMEDFQRRGRCGNCPFWQQGLWNVLSDVVSPDAIKYIVNDGSFFHMIHENPGVAGWMITWVKMLQMSPHLQGVRGGMERITQEMLARIRRKGVAVHLNHSLQALSAGRGKKLTLVFPAGQCTADHVILALPPHPLGSVHGLPEEIRGLLHSVIPIPLLKCFFVVKDPWWHENTPNRGIGDFPTRELHYYRQADRGNVMVYADRPCLNFWGRYVKAQYHDRAQINSDPDLPLAFAKRMKIDPGTILTYGIRDWGRDPYGGAGHLWRPGVEPWKVSEKLEAFALTDRGPANVHICGEAFSDFQGFMEGALHSADNALTKALE
jgi:monoamine oxidase